MISQNHEGIAQEVLSPLFNNCGDGGELPDIGGCMQELGAEWFAKKCYRVISMRQNRSHADAGSVHFHTKWEGKIL